MNPLPAPTAVTVRRGGGLIAVGRHEQRFAPADTLMVPADRPSSAVMDNAAYSTLQVPWGALRALAEQHTGLPGEFPRFEGTAPVSAGAVGLYASAAAYLYQELVASGVAGLYPLLAQELTGLAAGRTGRDLARDRWRLHGESRRRDSADLEYRDRRAHGHACRTHWPDQEHCRGS